MYIFESRLSCHILTDLSPRSDFVYPLFIHDDDVEQEIPSMPGCFRHSLDGMMKEIEEAKR